MKAAGIAWVFSQPQVGSLLLSAISINQCAQVNTMQKVKTRRLKGLRWIQTFEVALNRITSSLGFVLESMPSLPGQRDIDLLCLEQRMEAEGASRRNSSELSHINKEKVRARVQEQEKIQRYRYSGH